MIRVLHCVVGMNRGGIEGLLMNIYRSINRDEIQFDFLTSMEGIYDREIESLGGRVYRTPFISSVGPFAYRKNLLKFFDEHREYKIVHVHMDKFGGAVISAAKKRAVPVRIIHSHNIKNEGNFIIKAVKDYYGRKYTDATHFFACSDAAAKWMFGDLRQKAVIVKNGIIADRFSPQDSRDFSCFTVGNAARFSQQKNHEFLLQIFKQVVKKQPDSKLLLAGSGPLEEKMRRLAKDLAIADKVEFLGDCRDIPAFMAKLDVFCLPSLFEGLGIVLIEAQAAGVGCVASDTVPPEANARGTVEFLPLDSSPEIWADRLLKHKGEGRKDNIEKIKAAGYDVKNTAGQLERFYKERAKDNAQNI